MTEKFWEQINRIAKQIEEEEKDDKKLKIKMKELDGYVRSVTD